MNGMLFDYCSQKRARIFAVLITASVIVASMTIWTGAEFSKGNGSETCLQRPFQRDEMKKKTGIWTYKKTISPATRMVKCQSALHFCTLKKKLGLCLGLTLICARVALKNLDDPTHLGGHTHGILDLGVPGDT